MKTLIVGSGGRESALARAMAKHSTLFAVAAHRNPTIAAQVEETGGELSIGSVLDAEEISRFAQRNSIDLAMVSADDPLAAGVIDALQAVNIKAVGPTRAGAEIEWNKEFCRSLLYEVAPEANPKTWIAHDTSELAKMFKEIDDRAVVVKPLGLTGGKGVKVMGPHLADHEAAFDYANSILRDSPERTVIIEEKISGPEFTIQAISDGANVVFPPLTYDYPYRYDGDSGPGTGGMGSFSLRENELPFVSPEHYDEACSIIQTVVDKLRRENRHFNGVLNSGFFSTPNGVKAIEFNARFGDPECMNIMQIFNGNWVDMMTSLADQELNPASKVFEDAVSLVVYLVSPEYAVREGRRHEFDLDELAIENAGCRVMFSSAEKIGTDRYITVGNSRAVAITTSAQSIEEARTRVFSAIENHVSGDLEYRQEIGDSAYIQSLADGLGA